MNSNESRLHQAIADWNAGDLDAYMTLYADGVRLHGYTPEPLDRDAVRGFYEMIFAALPGSQISLEDAISEDDKVVARFVQTGRHDGELMGVPATGREVALPGITILRFQDGAVVERWSCADMLGLLVQIGAIPAPG